MSISFQNIRPPISQVWMIVQKSEQKWDDSLSNKLLRHPCPLLPPPRPSCLPSSGLSFIHGRVDQLLVIGDGHPTFIRESKPLLMGNTNPYYWIDDHPLQFRNRTFSSKILNLPYQCHSLAARLEKHRDLEK